MVMEACAYLCPEEKMPAEREGLKMHARKGIKRRKRWEDQAQVQRSQPWQEERNNFFLKAEYSKRERRKLNILK